jgi:hypothetical protein
MAFIDYYHMLGISSVASEEEIKTAYRRLVKRYHPDTSTEPDAAARFIELRMAYEVLSDPIKRQEYDELHNLGMSGVAPVGSARAGRRHAIPHYVQAAPVVIQMNPIVYSLTAEDVYMLLRRGMLRGKAPKMESAAYYCHRCQHRWFVFLPQSKSRPPQQPPPQPPPPTHCPRCQAEDWSEFLLLRCRYCTAIFECEGPLREPTEEQHLKGRLYFPYDLFPACPYCQRHHWCVAEEARLTTLDEEASLQASEGEQLP